VTITSDRGTVAVPEPGQLAYVRDRHWVVTSVTAGALPPDVLAAEDHRRQHLVGLSSVEDDGLGQELTVVWELEPAARTLATATLPRPQEGRFDDPARLDAFLDAVRWGAVTSADSKALQAPFRSGITIEDYQLDPVVRALGMPRVNLLVADDVGLGKTIEAGLVVQELLLRHRARTVLVTCPASLCVKWRDEMAEKFGLEFRIVDSDAVRLLRRERGVGANIFTHFPRLIVSMDWLKRDRGMRLLADVLPADAMTYPRRFDLLIVDEVHQAAPAGRGRYATDSQRTTLLKTLAPHFEHRLFLSATPHNGYSESWQAMLEMLDPQRFARGIKPNEEALRRILIRRLKSELREDPATALRPDGTARFPKRELHAIEVAYPDSERAVHADLAAYAELRHKQAKNHAAAVAADFVTLLLKKRLFSSPAAFASTLAVHLETLSGRKGDTDSDERAVGRLRSTFERVEEDYADDEEYATATAEALHVAARAAGGVTPEQQELLGRMAAWAEREKDRPDAKALELIQWLKQTVAPGEPDAGGQRGFNDERVIIFTEYRDTQAWLEKLLTAAGMGGERLALLYGGMDTETRERIKGEFQAPPSLKPVRILLATDAASEGIDLQRHCHRLVHLEIPFSPGRLEQRNGRVDRHLQPSPTVDIYHFVSKGYAAAAPGSLDADLQFLSLVARKVDQIRDDLGSAGPVLASQVEEAMLGRRRRIDEAALSGEKTKRAQAALRRIERNLREEVTQLREALTTSVTELGLSPTAVQRVVDVGLQLARQAPLQPTTLSRAPGDTRPAGPAFTVPPLTRSWARINAELYDDILDQQLPITFDPEVAGAGGDVVLAHLGHRLVAQSLRLLRAEIWSSGAEQRLGRVTARVVPDDGHPELAVIAHARLVLTGGDGHRLHEEVIAAGGRWSATGFARYNVGQVKAALDAPGDQLPPSHIQEQLVAAWPRIEQQLFRAVEARAADRRTSLERALSERADADAATVHAVLTELRASITRQLDELDEAQQLVMFEELDERAQYSRDVEALRRRVAAIPAEIAAEQAAVRRRYADPQPLLFPAAVTIVVPRRLITAGLGLGSAR
jgi:superfamily II DNA or RNA helicase